MNLIDKDALVAEIKRRRKLVSDPILSGNDLMIGERNALFNLLSFIDTLEVKEVDLEEEASKWEDKVYLECGYQDAYGTPHAPFQQIGDAFIAGAKLIINVQKGII